MPKLETKLTAAQIAIAEALFGGTYVTTLGKREGTPTSIPVPVADMPANAVLALFSYGVQRKFNDAVGGADVALADKVTAARQMVADFLEGKVAKVRGSGESVDPLTAAIRTVLRADYKSAWCEQNDKAGWKSRDEDEIVAGIDALFEQQDDATKDAIRAAAQESIDAAERARKAKAGLGALLKKA